MRTAEEGDGLRYFKTSCISGANGTTSNRPQPEERAISAFTRVFDALWRAPQHEADRNRA
jgi:hypothetical protein